MMDSMKLKEMNCDGDNNLTSSIQSITVDTLENFSPLAGPHEIGKRKFMITDILNNTNKHPPTQSGSPNGHHETLYPHTPSNFGGSAFQSLSSSTIAINSISSSTTIPLNFDLNSHHPAAAAAAMAAIGAAGTDLRMYSNFLPAAALQQIQQHREQLIMNHQRANSVHDDLDDATATHPTDVDVDEDNQGDSEG
jgi:hypothetical protein